MTLVIANSLMLFMPPPAQMLPTRLGLQKFYA